MLHTVICCLTWFGVYVAIPFGLIVVPVIASRWRFMAHFSVGKGILISTLLMWFLMEFLNVSVTIPRHTPIADDSMHDGTAVNAVIFMLGWLIALIFQLPHLMMRLLIEEILCSRKA